MDFYEVLNLKTKKVEFHGSQHDCREYATRQGGLYIIRENSRRRGYFGNHHLGAGDAWLKLDPSAA